jgi:osmotically-inducible protein OsmY
MKTDAQIKKDVEAELEWDAAVDASNIGVVVDKGVVTLSGHLSSFAEKLAAEKAAMRVAGVNAVAVELDVRLGSDAHRTDGSIANAAETALKWHAMVPENRVKVLVEKGWVTLSGEVDWEFQRQNAADAVRALTGVIGLTNGIALSARIVPDNVTSRIESALARQAEREAKAIQVLVNDHTVTLKGQVHSWAERTAAQGAAWSAQGVTNVVNELRVVG